MRFLNPGEKLNFRISGGPIIILEGTIKSIADAIGAPLYPDKDELGELDCFAIDFGNDVHIYCEQYTNAPYNPNILETYVYYDRKRQPSQIVKLIAQNIPHVEFKQVPPDESLPSEL